MKIRDLFEFEDIQKVIEIGKIKDEKELVETFVISPNLEEDILEFLEYFKGNKKEDNISVNIIGNYGTGKSHLLAFISLILSKPELIEYIQNHKIREEFQNLKRNFLIVKYELPAVRTKSLASIFFYRVKKQLKENYGIELRHMDLEKDDEDIKELVEEILLKIKEKYPTSGLLVLFDEFSDFIKQKDSADRHFDLMFAKQLAECSMRNDFILMLSMQEHIFGNPEYVVNAEEIKKYKERFLPINITSENVEDIIAKRIVKKNSNQVQELKRLFLDIEDKFSNLALEEDRYIKLFPVHPYVVEALAELPYFENRSILQFISSQIKKIMDNEFPSFLTFDLIYDEMIQSEHTVKNHPDVKPLVEVMASLLDITNRLEPNYRGRALKLVKSLAILNLIGPKKGKSSDKSKFRGETAQRLAENLFIIPKSKIISPEDDITTIFGKIMEKSEGQFIGQEGDVYYINLEKITDYERIVDMEAGEIDDLPYINEKFVENFLLDELDLPYKADINYWESSKKYVLNDSVNWKQRKSFREGKLAIEIGYKLKIDEKSDYLVTLLGYGKRESDTHHQKNIIIKPLFTDDLIWSMKRLAAIEKFIRTRSHLDVMKNKKRVVIDEELKKGFSKSLRTAEVSYKGKTFTLEELGIDSHITAEIFGQIKENLLGEDLTQDYPDYPRFKSKLSSENIKGTVESVLKDISQKQGIVKDLLNQSTNILIPLRLYRDGMLDVVQSNYARQILDTLETSTTNVAIKDVLNKFQEKPYGLQDELVYLIIAVLLRNGDIMLSSKQGKRYSASDFTDLFRSGLDAFYDIRYMIKEEVPPPEAQLLFDSLDLDRSLLQIRKDWPIAYRNYMEKIETIERDLNRISDDFETLKGSVEIGLPLGKIKNQIRIIEEINFHSLKIKSLTELKNFDYSPERLKRIKEGYNSIKTLKSLFKDCFDYILHGIDYMKNAMDWIDNEYFKQSDRERLSEIYEDSMGIVSDIHKLLKEDERKPLKGKIDQFRDRYKEIYYQAHKEMVGDGVDWVYLDKIEHSTEFKDLNILKDVKSIKTTNFRELQLKIKDLRDLKCTDFRVDQLDISSHCRCMFPRGNYDPNINQTINQLGEEVERLKKTWINQIIGDVNDNQAKIVQLDDDEEETINSIISQGKLPDHVDYQLVKAINNLLDDIIFVDIDLNQLYDTLTFQKDSFKVEEFKNVIESYIDEKIDGETQEKVRINIIKGSKN